MKNNENRGTPFRSLNKKINSINHIYNLLLNNTSGWTGVEKFDFLFTEQIINFRFPSTYKNLYSKIGNGMISDFLLFESIFRPINDVHSHDEWRSKIINKINLTRDLLRDALTDEFKLKYFQYVIPNVDKSVCFASNTLGDSFYFENGNFFGEEYRTFVLIDDNPLYLLANSFEEFMVNLFNNQYVDIFKERISDIHYIRYQTRL